MTGNPRLLLSVTGILEAATGLALLVAPSALVELLLGVAPDTPAGVTVSRVAGVALLALGVACWLARNAGSSAQGLITSMLLYNVGTIGVLVSAWAGPGLFGIALWPVVLAHVVLAAWCVVGLRLQHLKGDRAKLCADTRARR